MRAWFTDFTDALTAGEQEYLRCRECETATLPPRQLCPECGSTALTREPLSDRGEVVSYTEISVTIPKFHGETPYTVVLARFDAGVTLTGQLREATADDVAIGDEVDIGSEAHEEGTPVITFQPAETA